MLFSEKMNAAINAQIGRKFAASLEYVSIASSFAPERLTEAKPKRSATTRCAS